MKGFYKYYAIGQMLFLLVSTVAAQPSLIITSPADGTITTDHFIRVEGTSEGTAGAFNHTTEADFLLGTPENISVNPSGQIELGGTGLGPPTRQNNGDPVITADGTGFDSSGVGSGVVLYEDNTFKMWYIGGDGSKSQTGYATSTDGISWNRLDNPVLTTSTGWEATRATILGLINDTGTFRAMYNGHDTTWNDRIGYATSPDGSTSFTKQNGGNPVMGPGAGGKFDDFGVFGGPLLKEGTTFKMYYIGSDGTHFRIGLAHSSDCISWTRQNNGNTILPLGTSGSFDDWDISQPSVFKYGGKYYMFYHGDTDSNHNDWKIGYATSDDGITFTRENEGQPWLSVGTNGKFDDATVRNPRGIVIGSTLHLWYTGTPNSGSGGVGYVKATFGGNTGIFTSPPLDAGGAVNWGSIDYTAEQPSGTTLVVKTRSSDDGVAWSSWQAVVDGGDIISPDNRFIQYQVIMTRTGQNTPSLKDISIDYIVPVSKVEVSLDQTTWFPADGTMANWYLDLEVQEGSNTIYVKATDISGHSTIKNVDIVADFTPPTGSIEINGGDIYTMNPSCIVALSAGDLSGIDAMMLSIYSDFTGAFWMTYAQEETWTIGGPDGNHTLYVKYRDNSGLESQVYSDSIILDTTPPNGTMRINGGETYTKTKAVTLDIDATDENGIGGVIISDDQIFSGSFIELQESHSWTLDGEDGQKFVWARVKDSAGHTMDLADDIVLDTTPPEVFVEAAGGVAVTGTELISLAIDAEDTNGVTEMMVSSDPGFNGAEWLSYNEAISYILPSGDGPKTIYVKVKDVAGNVATSQASIELRTTPPEALLKINDGARYTNDNDVVLSITVNNESEMDSIMVSNDPSFIGTTWTSFSGSVPWTLSQGDGAKTVHLRLRNIYGIANSNISATIILDTTAPTVSITEPAKGKISKKALTITGTGSDENELLKVEIKMDVGNWTDVTGLQDWTYTVDKLSLGKHAIIVKATDKAGNEQVTAKEFKRINTSQNTPGFGLLGLMVAIFVVALGRRRRK